MCEMCAVQRARDKRMLVVLESCESDKLYIIWPQPHALSRLRSTYWDWM